jgi:hypothetical protein
MYYKLKNCFNINDLKKERTAAFNRLIRNPKVILNLRLRSYLNDYELETLRNIVALFKYNSSIPIEFIKQYNLNKYIKRSMNEPAKQEDINEYFKIYNVENIKEYEYKLLKVLDMISMDYIKFIKLIE